MEGGGGGGVEGERGRDGGWQNRGEGRGEGGREGGKVKEGEREGSDLCTRYTHMYGALVW